MSNVIKFPGPTEVIQEQPEPEGLRSRFVIGDKDFYANSVSRPLLFHQEWTVFNLEGRAHVPGESYWAPLYVSGCDELGDLIQELFPLDKMSLEILDKDNVLIEWWEFKEVFLSTESDSNELVIHYRDVTTREFVGNSS